MLTDLSFDLQVQICKFLQPPEILALRQTNKAFHQVTFQQIVWIHALNRICHDNFLFLPTFPIHDMSDAVLERAATTPFRWIALSSSTARNDSDVFQLRITRTIKNPIASVTKDLREDLRRVYLVPGGRYLVISGWSFLGVWDLTDVSDSESGKSIGMWEAVDGLEGYIDFIVHPTPDGLGIRILVASHRYVITCVLYVFEIYPQQETPKLAKLAEFSIINLQEVSSFTYSLNGNRVAIHERVTGRFIVWDFMAETMAGWSILTIPNIPIYEDKIIRVTETAIIIHKVRFNSLLIFEIPPLKAKKTPFDINEDLPLVTPVLSYVDASAWFQTPDSWYSGDLSSLPLYVDISDHHNKRKRCRLDITCDFSTIRLVQISQERLKRPRRNLGEYRICDDRFVNVFNYSRKGSIEVDLCEGFGLSNGQAHSLSQIRDMCFTFPLTRNHPSFCPASARFIFKVENDIVIAEIL